MPKADGVIIVTSPDAPTIERDTLQCVHCGGHWVVVPGSGRKRGWCLKCNGALCGQHDCMRVCYPYKKRLDDGATYGRLIWPV